MVLNSIKDWFLHRAKWWQVWYWQSGIPPLLLLQLYIMIVHR